MQGLYYLVTAGLGTLLGSLLAGEVTAWSGGVGPRVFAVPFGIDVGLLAAFLALFPRDDAQPDAPGDHRVARAEAQLPTLAGARSTSVGASPPQ